jgi:predicted nuclease of predicted toxin-antitoxin system
MGSVAHLRRLGYNIAHLREQGLQRLLDPEILEKARDEGRVLQQAATGLAQGATVSVREGQIRVRTLPI